MFLLRSSSYDEKINPLNIISGIKDNNENLIVIPESCGDNIENNINQYKDIIFNSGFQTENTDENDDFYKLVEENITTDDSIKKHEYVDGDGEDEGQDVGVEDDTIEDDTIEDDAVEDDAVEDDAVEDDAVEDDENYNYFKECYLNDIDPDFLDGDIYIISINNVPYFYENNLKDARNQLWNISKKLSAEYSTKYYNDESINMLIDFKDKDNINIVTNYNLWFITLNSTKYQLKIDKVVKTI